MASGRSFSRASLSGNPVGRPRTAAPEPSQAARALLAAQNWQSKRGLSVGQDQPAARSAQSGGAISAARGQQRAERRFEGEEAIGRQQRLPRPELSNG